MATQVSIERHIRIYTPAPGVRYQVFKQERPDRRFVFYMAAEHYEVALSAFNTAKTFEPHFLALAKLESDGTYTLVKHYSCTELSLRAVEVRVIL